MASTTPPHSPRTPHRRSSGRATALVAACLVLLLGACSAPPAPQIWSGTSTVDGRGSALRLELVRTATAQGERLRGSYTVGDGATGSLTGTLADGAIVAELAPSGDCTYTLTGTLTNGRLTGEFAPDGCPGGGSGSWALERE